MCFIVVSSRSSGGNDELVFVCVCFLFLFLFSFFSYFFSLILPFFRVEGYVICLGRAEYELPIKTKEGLEEAVW